MQNQISYITLDKLADVIRQERRRREITMEAMGEMVGKSRQWIHQAEKSGRITPKLTELRMEIFRELFPGEVLSGPVLIRSTPSEATIFEQDAEQKSKAA